MQTQFTTTRQQKKKKKRTENGKINPIFISTKWKKHPFLIE